MYSIPTKDNSDQANMVHDLEVIIGKKTVAASYYVEGGVIIAMIGNKTYQCPVGSVPSADTVRAILMEVAMAGQV